MNRGFFVLVVLFGIYSCGENDEKSQTNIEDKVLTIKMPEPDTAWAKKARFVADSFYLNYLSQPGFNGHFLLAKNGYIIYSKSVGKANFEKNITLSDTTPIHVASISKVATSLAILRLVAQKKIDLDTSVKSYLPNFPYRDIRILDLLSH